MTPEQRRDWRDYVLGAEALTLAQRVVLLALETFADYRDGTNARPGIDRLMQKCRLTDRAVEKALKRGRDMGLIHRTANGSGRRAAVYRLVPVLNSPNSGSGQDGNSPNGGSGLRPDSPNSGSGNDGNSPNVGSSLPRTAVPPTTPGPHKRRGLRNGGTALDDPDAYAINPASREQQSANGNAPTTRCAKHAHIPADAWVGENCRDCGALRKATKASEAEHRRAAVQVIHDCPDCDDLGRIEVDDGLKLCPQHISWAQAQGGKTA
ncbi:MarR family winged helix-turn-helix transcriptional regulator [Mycobacteroides salmoniphilum]|uniref:MarR family winged helix-turn-helix transcriptional regulator n=1 Tax=Mycobacteroides salmoniphilum TaxID=404941 RepID=UPI000991D238|nr:MarR family winged helix-turn-helix transcriptional regulator [Mycobacteroides salmoniphilum]